MASTSDFTVIGAGILGLATALELQGRHPSVHITVLEKEPAPAFHQSGRNSGVIHAGVYYRPGSFKARLCREGVAATQEFCAEHDIPTLTCGKLIVATDARELADLAGLEERSRANGIQIERVDGADISRMEPHITGIGGLLSPTTGIVDFAEVTRVMARLFTERGGTIRYGARVLGGGPQGDGVWVETPAGRLESGAMICCAGLQSDRLIRAFGLDPGFRIIPFRGEYFRILNQPADLVSHLIYPVPDPERPFLGVHLTRKMAGGFTVGPNAVLAMHREGYGPGLPRPGDMVDTFSWPGFWRMLSQHRTAAATELADSLSRKRYLKRVQRYCSRVRLQDLAPMRPGIRAQAVTAEGRLMDDFHFISAGRAFFVGNAPSPAATSARPIARHVVDTLGV